MNLSTLFDDGWTALHLSTCTNEEMFVYLHEVLHADLLTKNKNGVTVLHKAAKDDSTYLITYLLEKDVFHENEKDKDGNCPLHYACVFQSKNAIRWLIGFGYPLNEVNDFGQIALQ